MRVADIHYLICPGCHGDLVPGSIEKQQGDRLEEAELVCQGCQKSYPIVRFIPRFVPIENYASNFGHEWTIHAKTQYDSYSGAGTSKTRFFNETGWSQDLTGELLLEVGSGSGRFTEQAISTGAFVISMDYSYAVEANYASNGACENVLIVQGDVYAMPFRRASFDKVFCFGVLQHTPDVHASFQALPLMLKPGGKLVADVYKKTFARTFLATKYFVRYFTRNQPPELLYRRTRRYVDFIWPFAMLISKLPRIGPVINWRLLVPDYSRKNVTPQVLKEWAYLDIFDMLSPRYDSPQTMPTFQRWFIEAGLVDITLYYGYTGIVGRGTKSDLVAVTSTPDSATSASVD